MLLKNIARRARPRAAMEEMNRARISIETGVEGDTRGQPGERQITVLSWESWCHACAGLEVDLPWLLRRANLLIEGFEFLPTDVGRRLQIGEVILEITRETDPCSRMEQQQAGLCDALQPSWRGGVCCRVLHSGEVKVGMPVFISA